MIKLMNTIHKMKNKKMWICVLQLHVLFLLIIFCCKISCILDNTCSSSMEEEEVQKTYNYRTAFHFQPPQNWMNGPVYYKGVYHLFYQNNPTSPLFGKISWGHSVSRDLINWVHLDRILNPSESYDINGCWSGSITVLPGGEPVILYTGVNVNNTQVQNMAMLKNISDPLLKEWVKSELNPIMIPLDEPEYTNFRDPTTAWLGPDGIWRVVIGGDGNAVLYRSADFIRWERSDRPLYGESVLGKTGMWECPDFFPVFVGGKKAVDVSVFYGGIKYVLKVSLEGSRDEYIIGNYDVLNDKFEPESEFMDRWVQMRYDYGKFYASKSFFDGAKSRRVLWAWIPESDGDDGAVEKGWAGLQSIPRTILMAESGNRLIQWPVEEIEKLRSNQVKIRDKILDGGDLIEIQGITAWQADVEASFKLGNLELAEDLDEKDLVDARFLCSSRGPSSRGAIGPFGLLVLASEGLEEQTAIFFRVFRINGAKYVVLMCSDQSRSSLGENFEKTAYGAFVDVDPLSEEISLRTLVDGSIVESFGGGGLTCITARVYPKLAIEKKARLYMFNNGTSDVTISKINAWSMKSAQFSQSHSTREIDVLSCQHQFGFGDGVFC